jgi:hypothetical protein
VAGIADYARCIRTIRPNLPHRLSATAFTLLAALAGSVGCSDDKADPTKPAAAPALAVQVGQCLQVTAALDSEVAKLPVIDCAQEHTHEIFAAIEDTDDDVFPGATKLEAFSETACYGAFEGYVGINWLDSSLFITWIYPSLTSWNNEDDREVLCVLGAKNATPLTGTMKDKKI